MSTDKFNCQESHKFSQGGSEPPTGGGGSGCPSYFGDWRLNLSSRFLVGSSSLSTGGGTSFGFFGMDPK